MQKILMDIIKEYYGMGDVPILSRRIISLVSEVQENAGNGLKSIDLQRVSDDDPRIETHQLWTSLHEIEESGECVCSHCLHLQSTYEFSKRTRKSRWESRR